ncbi:hypothetical protein EDD86DRAFT_248774 [Gorgonomyces haynaldii]|nr:hypothetical protein EDD86DRAFT_248774 [Gorgonomyces haynaldii]
MSWQELLLPPLEFDFGPDAYPRNTPLTKQLQQMDRSQLVIDAMVDCALMIRKSTLPDTIVELLETFIAFLDEIETRYMFVTRVKQLLFNIITLWIQLWSVLIMGLMQSVIAYHRQAKPTRKRIGFQHTIEINVGGTLFHLSWCNIHSLILEQDDLTHF